ncbi:hypothetical protein GCK32_008004 [Trichostrongylus colubriformis]|uniref:Uncharacterized protein n=1 Tax=Trichostrongylus colubriformis TaxID=6319 RepID=A0AAN8FM11_TRICO
MAGSADKEEQEKNDENPAKEQKKEQEKNDENPAKEQKKEQEKNDEHLAKEQRTQQEDAAAAATPKQTKSTTPSKSKEASKESGDVGTVLWCGSDVYLIIIGVILVIFALFNFFGDTASKVTAALKLILAIAFAITIAYAVLKKDAQIMAGIMIAALIFIGFDVIGILISLFGNSTMGETVTSVFFALIRIAFLVHIFYIANRVRRAYKGESLLPK